MSVSRLAAPRHPLIGKRAGSEQQVGEIAGADDHDSVRSMAVPPAWNIAAPLTPSGR
jgi:hypothetical protein